METIRAKVSFSTVLSQLPGTSGTLDKTVFMFPGQGSQFLYMGYDWYKTEPVFTAAIDECADIINLWLNEDIRNIIYPPVADTRALATLNNTYYTQSAIGIISYALAKLWMSRGIKPFLLLGHSIGEFMAAHFAGVFSLRDALFLITSRGRIMSQLPAGAMLAIRAEYDDILQVMPATLSLAAINAPGSCVVAGAVATIADFSKQLSGNGIAVKLLKTSHAFHSALMSPIIPAFEDLANSVTLNKPLIPLISTITGKLMTDDEATDAYYWSRNIVLPVRFSDAASVMLAYEPGVILEIGPGDVTTKLIGRQMPAKNTILIPSLVGI